MDEHLERESRSPGGCGRSRQGQLAGQDDARATQLAGERDPFLARDRHLGRRVDLEIGRDRADQAGQPQVLNDHGVNTGRGQLADRDFEVGQLAGKGQRVQGRCSLSRPAGATAPSPRASRPRRSCWPGSARYGAEGRNRRRRRHSRRRRSGRSRSPAGASSSGLSMGRALSNRDVPLMRVRSRGALQPALGLYHRTAFNGSSYA